METFEKVSIFAGLNVKGGIHSPTTWVGQPALGGAPSPRREIRARAGNGGRPKVALTEEDGTRAQNAGAS